MIKVDHYSNLISEATVKSIPAKDCYKVKVRNSGPTTVWVNNLPIEPDDSEVFEIAGGVFAKDFEFRVDDGATDVQVYYTRYFDPKC